MKPTPLLRCILFIVVFVVVTMIGWLPSAQASIDDFIKIYQQIESYAPSGALPASSKDIETYKKLFQCIEGGGDVVQCTNEFHKTDAGKKATADIPEGVWQVVEAYVAWKSGDVWGVVEHLGAAAMCAVLQVLAGGFDACGLIKDLIAVGEAFLDAGKAVAEFFNDLGKAVGGAIEDAYCATVGSLLGGCDDSGPPPKPKSQVIYEKFFAPKVLPDGLIAIEEDDPIVFLNLFSQLSGQAKAKGYKNSDVAMAAIMFSKAVNAQWTADIVKNVLKELAAVRNFYNTNNIYAEAKHAWNQYKEHKKLPLDNILLPRCKDHFKGFWHVDRWISGGNTEAEQLKVQSMYEWCEKVFWEGNKSNFAQYFKKFMEPICPGLGCSSKADLEFCQPFMKSVGLNCVFVASSKQQPQLTVGSKPMVPTVQPAQGQASSAPQTQSQPSAVERVSPSGLPDITSAVQITIGTTSASWGTTVNVDAKQAFLAQNGVCQFTVQHTARNIGLASTGAFDSIWTNSNAQGSWSRTWGSISSGGQGTQKDMVMLKPGMNILNLKLDNPLKVQESNENNNQFRVIVNLSGACGAVSRIAPPSAERLNTPANSRLPVTPERASDPVLRR